MKQTQKAGRALERIVEELKGIESGYRAWVLAWALGWLLKADPQCFDHFKFGLDGFLRTNDEEYSTNYPMSSKKSLVGKVKGARKFVKAKDLPKGGGVGKAVDPVSPGKKGKAKRKK